jgi:hypothetical protein
MAGLKSFLYGVAPILGVTGAVLYERQRALVSLGVLKAAKGRGPGSGVPLTAENVAAVIISVLATENLSEVDKRVVSLINAAPVRIHYSEDSREWDGKVRALVLVDAIGSILSGKGVTFPDPKGKNVFEMRVTAIRITRCWRAQLVASRSLLIEYNPKRFSFQQEPPISITAEIEGDVLKNLVAFTRGAMSQAAEEDEE